MAKLDYSKKYVDVKIIALKFNECINNHDIEGLSALMTEDHTFISKLNDAQRGKEEMIKSWKKFFTLFPKYRNEIHFVYSKANFVIMVGNSESLEGPAIWTSYIQNNLVSEWRVFDDTEKNRAILGINEKIIEQAQKKKDELSFS
jgi:hypothetical protein